MNVDPTRVRYRSRVALILLLGAVAAWGQQAETGNTASTSESRPRVAQVSFSLERPGLPVPRFVLQVNEDGSALYEADQVFTPQGGAASAASQHVTQKLSLTRTTTAQIFASARALDRFTIKCASELKNIADTGRKTLRYTGEDGDGSCAYNYSQDKRVLQLTELFEGIAYTLDMGRKLDFTHRFDRLGLDEATASLAEAVEAGRAIEVGAISSTLRSIAQDSEVMERVRLRAAKLLQRAQPAA